MMKTQDLNQEEINLLKEGENLAEKCDKFIAKLEAAHRTNKRDVAISKTNLQQGFMWATRSVAMLKKL